MINDVIRCSHCGGLISLDEDGYEVCFDPECPGTVDEDPFLRQQERKQLGIGQ